MPCSEVTDKRLPSPALLIPLPVMLGLCSLAPSSCSGPVSAGDLRQGSLGFWETLPIREDRCALYFLETNLHDKQQVVCLVFLLLLIPLCLPQYIKNPISSQFSSVAQSCPTLTPWTAAHQAFLSITNSRRLFNSYPLSR